MSTWGVTATGFNRKTFSDISTDLQTKLRAGISPLLRFAARDKFGSLVAVFSDAAAQVWELAEAVYHGSDPDSSPTDEQFEMLCRLTGITRTGPQRGEVPCTLVVESGFDALASTLVANPAGRPAELWRNRERVTSAGGGTLAGVVFESLTLGETPFVASGDLDTISGAVTGWTSIVSTADATPGQAIEAIDALRVRRDASLARAGGSTLAGIQADVQAVTGVIEADARENYTGAYADIPAHSFEIVIYDGEVTPLADDDAVAQAIWDSRPPGATAVGSTHGHATDAWATSQTVPFSRASAVPVYIILQVTGDYDTDEVEAALVALYPPEFRQTIVVERLRSVLFAVDGVVDVPSLTVSTDDVTYSSSNLVPTFGEIFVLDTDRITWIM
jgi:hypothetical protein